MKRFLLQRGWPRTDGRHFPCQPQPCCPHKVRPKPCSPGRVPWTQGQEPLYPLTGPLEPTLFREMALEHPKPLLTSSNRPGGPSPLSLPPGRTVTQPEETMSIKVPIPDLSPHPPHAGLGQIYNPRGAPRWGQWGQCARQRGTACQLRCSCLLERGDKKTHAVSVVTASLLC